MSALDPTGTLSRTFAHLRVRLIIAAARKGWSWRGDEDAVRCHLADVWDAGYRDGADHWPRDNPYREQASS